MTTELGSLQTSLGVLIGDSNDTYSSNYTKAINNASAEIPDVLFIPLDDTDGLPVVGGDYRYQLPSDFQEGHLSQVQIEISSDEDDLDDARWETVYGWKVISDGTTKNLMLSRLYTEGKIIRLIGYKTLETLSDSSDTISIDGERVNLLLSYSAFKLFEIESQEIQYIADGYTSDIASIDDEIDTPVASINTLKATITTADTALNDITGAIATVTTAVDDRAAEIETVDTDITGVQTGIDLVITSIATIQGVIDTAVSAVATVGSEDISRYEAAIARNQGQIGRLDGDIQRMVDARTRYQDKRKRLQEKRDEVKAKRDNLMVKRDAKDADIKRLDDQRQRLDDEIARFEAERNRIAQKRNESKDVMARLKERSIEWLGKYYRLLPSLRMTPPTVTMKVGF